MRNYNAGFLFLLKRPQEAHSRSTQRLRSFEQEQKDKLESNVIEFSFLMPLGRLMNVLARSRLPGLGLVLAGIIYQTGCALFPEDNTNEPAALVDIKPTLEVREVWERSFGGGIDEQYLRLAPLLVQETLFVTDAKGKLGAFTAAEGKVLWQQSADVNVSAGMAGDEDLVAIGTEDGEILAFSAQDGHALWKQRLSSEVMAISGVVLGIIVARTNDSKIHGLDAVDGRVLWQSSHTAPVLTLRGQSVPNIVDDKVIVGFDDGKLEAISLSRGNVLWQTVIGTPEGRSELERLVDIDGAIYVDKGVIYVAGFRGKAAAVNLADGRVLWVRDFSSYMGLDVDPQHVYVTDDQSNVWALDRRTGASLWKQDKFKYRKLTAPAAVGKYITVGDYEGYIHWLSQTDGQIVARTFVDNEGILAQPVVMGSRVYVLGNGGDIAVLEAIPEEGSKVSLAPIFL